METCVGFEPIHYQAIITRLGASKAKKVIIYWLNICFSKLIVLNNIIVNTFKVRYRYILIFYHKSLNIQY